MLSRRSLLLGWISDRRRDMVQLPGGTFRMGSDEASLRAQFPTAGRGLMSMLLAETPAHEQTIPPFRIDRYEVTNRQFQSFIRARPQWSRQRIGGDYLKPWMGDRFPEGTADFPVAFVTWEAAVAFAAWTGKRLPTEAEWEFAARGGRDDCLYPWGREAPSPERANYRGSATGHAVNVGSYPPNPYGIFDLAGNVWEFCLDAWQPRYRPGPQFQTGQDIRRMQHAAAERRVIRGGSYDGTAVNLRVAARDSHPVNHAVAFVGFRCAI
jgi:formylglycine-generating enzyme required for sulfatase activity